MEAQKPADPIITLQPAITPNVRPDRMITVFAGPTTVAGQEP